MSIQIAIAMILAVVAAAWLLSWLVTSLAARRAQQQADALRLDIQTRVDAQSSAVAAQLAQLSQSVSAQIGNVLQQVQSGVASTGALTSGAQKAVADELRASTEMLGNIQKQMGEFQQVTRHLSDATRQIETVLGGAKTRGVLGEIALERMLADCLPPATYQMQYRFTTGETVDAVVRSRERLLPIDSKFPLEDYRRMVENGEEARGKFSQVVRKHAESIAKKYILPGEDTLDIALMFVPSEGVYCELLQSEDANGGALDEYCRARCVIPVSPSMLFALLRVILMGFQGMQIEENARHLQASLGGLKKQFDNFGELYAKLGNQLRLAQQSYSEADRKLVRACDALEDLAQGAPIEKTLDGGTQASLPLIDRRAAS